MHNLQKKERFDIRLFYFPTMGVFRHWNRLSRDDMDTQCLEMLKNLLDKALSNFFHVGSPLRMGLDCKTSKDPSNPNYSTVLRSKPICP